MKVTEAERKESTKRLCGGGCPQRDSAEHEEYAEALIGKRMTENNITNADRREDGLLEAIVSAGNMNRAYKRVKKNKGASGVDGMKVDELLQYLKDRGEEIRQSILAVTYTPQPVRRVEIPKDNGKTRKLGIPTAVDRVIQQAIAQVLTPIYEPKFVETSYGFRPGRSAHGALRKSLEYLKEGYEWAVDMDLEKFFDTVNQSKLMEILARDIKDGRVLSLIHRYLRAGAIECRRFVDTEIGVPQGGPLSPLCANIMLNELDHELERRGHKFVRYADDNCHKLFHKGVWNERSKVQKLRRPAADAVRTRLDGGARHQQGGRLRAGQERWVSDAAHRKPHPDSQGRTHCVDQREHQSRGIIILRLVNEIILDFCGRSRYVWFTKHADRRQMPPKAQAKDGIFFGKGKNTANIV